MGRFHLFSLTHRSFFGSNRLMKEIRSSLYRISSFSWGSNLVAMGEISGLKVTVVMLFFPLQRNLQFRIEIVFEFIDNTIVEVGEHLNEMLALPESLGPF